MVTVEQKNNAIMGQRVLVGSLTIVILALVAFAALSVKFSQVYYSNSPNEVRLGLLFDEQPFNQRLKAAALAAVEDINSHVKGLSPSPPIVHVFHLPNGGSMDQQMEQLSREHSVEIFIKGAGRLKSDCLKCLVVSPFGGIPGGVNTGPSDNDAAKAYNQLFRLTGGKTVSVIPVVDVSRDLYLLNNVTSLLAEDQQGTMNQTSTVILTSPVYYNSTGHLTDAMKVISDIGSRTGAVRNTETIAVFLMSAHLLPQIVQAVKMYPRLQGLRWFVRDALVHEDLLHTDPSARRFATKTGLTSLSVLGVNHDATAFERLRHRLSFRERMNSTHGSYFYEVYVYENLMRVHKAFTEADNMSTFKSALRSSYRHRSTSSVAFMFDPGTEGVTRHPDYGWIPLGVWNNSAYKRHVTHPLSKAELTRVAKESCKSVQFNKVQIFLHRGPLTPDVTTCYYDNLNDFPDEALVVAASRGVTIVMDCKDDFLRFEYACLPVKFDIGRLECTKRSARKRKPYR